MDPSSSTPSLFSLLSLSLSLPPEHAREVGGELIDVADEILDGDRPVPVGVQLGETFLDDSEIPLVAFSQPHQHRPREIHLRDVSLVAPGFGEDFGRYSRGGDVFAAVASDVATTATSTSVVPAHANVATAHVTNNRTKSRPPSVSGVISPYPTVVTVVTAQ